MRRLVLSSALKTNPFPILVQIFYLFKTKQVKIHLLVLFVFLSSQPIELKNINKLKKNTLLNKFIILKFSSFLI